ncbi:MAG TPA: MerR family transcriptional regulator [Chloroflexota bacterium]|nr:MerR family transcriptional regulator [Chloroflexota bacterium]
MHSSDPDAVYPISSAAQLVGMHANTLRKYERQRLIHPSRTTGNLRLFSPSDLARLRQIKRLVDDGGVNLAGVEIILDLTERLFALRDALTSESPGTTADVRRHLEAMLATLRALPAEAGEPGYSTEDADESRGARTESDVPGSPGRTDRSQ